MSLKEYTIEELQSEIAERIKRKSECPTPLKQPKWKELKDLCIEHVEEMNSNPDQEFDAQYFYEAAMEALYGKEFWDWLNARR